MFWTKNKLLNPRVCVSSTSQPFHMLYAHLYQHCYTQWQAGSDRLPNHRFRNGFRPARRTVDQLFTLVGLLMGLWEDVFCVLGEGWRPSHTGNPLGHAAEVWGTKAKVKAVSVFTHFFSGCWSPQRLPLVSNPVCDTYGQDLKSQPQNCISVFFRWHGSLGFIRLWPSTLPGAVYSWDESGHLQVWGHSFLLPLGWEWVAAPAKVV